MNYPCPTDCHQILNRNWPSLGFKPVADIMFPNPLRLWLLNTWAQCMALNSFCALTFTIEALIVACLQYKSFEKNMGKGEIARNEQFLLFPTVFLPYLRTFWHFYQIKNCRLQSLFIWKSLKFVVWERVNGLRLLNRVIEKFQPRENKKYLLKRQIA